MWTDHTEYEEYQKLQLSMVDRYQHNNTLGKYCLIIVIEKNPKQYRDANAKTLITDTSGKYKKDGVIKPGLYPKSPLYPHSLFPTLVHSYSSLEGVSENEWVNSDTECTGRTAAFA